MLKLPDYYMHILTLKKEDHSIQAIAQISGHSRNTIRRVLRAEHSLQFKTPVKTSKLDSFKVYLTRQNLFLHREFSTSNQS